MVMWVVVMAALGTGLVLMMASQGREGDTRLGGKYRAMQFAAERRAAAEVSSPGVHCLASLILPSWALALSS